MKFATISIDVKENPVFIVGINPGRQRKSQQTYRVWEGNRSGDLVMEAIDGYDNLFLTNVCNYQDAELNEEKYEEGLEDLLKNIIELKPKRIICLGAMPHLAVRILSPPCEVVKLMHPSFIVRFNKDRKAYIKKLRGYLC